MVDLYCVTTKLSDWLTAARFASHFGPYDSSEASRSSGLIFVMIIDI